VRLPPMKKFEKHCPKQTLGLICLLYAKGEGLYVHIKKCFFKTNASYFVQKITILLSTSVTINEVEQ
jgi:hypothetical protein